MNKIILLAIGILSFSLLNAQNVGINQSTPTNSLHITPINLGDNPLRVEGLQAYTVGDTSILVVSPATGIVKYMNASELSSSILNSTIINSISDSLLSNITFINNFGDSLFLSQSFTDNIISTLYNNADTLLYNSNFINNLRDSIDTDVDSVILNGTILHIYENGNDLSANLSNLQDGTGTDNQTLTLTNNTLSINGGNSVDLSNFATPSGAVFAFPNSTPPTGYLACNGQAVSRTTYANLFSLLGTNYGAGDGTTTFNLPNYNGQFLRGWDNGQGIDLDASSRIDRGDGTTGDAVGTKQSNATLAHNHTVNPPATNSNSTGNHLHTINPPSTNSSATGNHLHTVNPPATNTNTTGSHAHTIDPPNTATTTNGNHTHTMPGYHLSSPGNQIPWYNWANNTYANNTNTTSAAGNHTHTLNIPAFNSASTGNHAHSVNIPQFNSSTTGNHSHTTDVAPFNSSTTGNHSHTTDIAQFNSGSNGGLETRPTNISVLWCIKF